MRCTGELQLYLGKLDVRSQFIREGRWIYVRIKNRFRDQGGIIVQILPSRARTIEEIRREIQNSKESLKVLSERYGVNFKTILKWKHRDFVHDMSMGKKNPHSTVLTREEEAICVAFRKHTLLPLDGCLYTLQEKIPHLSRSSLHRLFKRQWQMFTFDCGFVNDQSRTAKVYLGK